MKVQINVTDEKGNLYEGTVNLTKVMKGKRKPTSVKSTSKKPKPSLTIRNLYEEKYFSSSKSLGEVSKKLSSKGYNFNPDSVYRALQRSGFLKRKGTTGKFKFVQKYPPQ
ncbi:MAG: hypothetical protein GWN01_11985 [Nitrosopumilaceae archaeon]|nr:hypothetical protein [Nitrosopumilaceae archaeon]NIU01596.1 hypothetical protein [Nitrosopumilaceae archaeon]NIU88015.1 hypothetical protein [Nitrosopumilaceae archaeon]NIV66282.1 hypothetical protein [Nitrosopumilaceae archaeon]NIX62198.1 hypothetical protein [Nitrosopumilaceae archaeon]